MKKLRKIFGPNGWLSTSTNGGTPQKRNASRGKRRLNSEALEKRELLAGDLASGHNYLNQHDVDGNREVSPVDALMVINSLRHQRGGASGEQLAGDLASSSKARFYPDVNNDGSVTPADALTVINAIRRGEGETDDVPDLLELLITARDENDDELPQTNGVYEVAVGEVFDLEISYDDLRRSRDDAGAFTVIVDLLTDTGNTGGLRPLLAETQEFGFDESIFEIAAENEVESITFAQAGTTNSIDIDFLDFLDDEIGSIQNAYEAFGVTDPDSITINDDLLFPNSAGTGDILGYQIAFKGREFLDMNIPNLEVTVNTVAGSTYDPETFINSFDPTLANGDPNPLAIFNSVDFRSRTFNNNRSVYDFLLPRPQDAGFDPATGVTGIGGTGPLLDALEDNDGNLILPFDAFSIPVQFTQPVSGATVSVLPSSGESIALYGDFPGDDPDNPRSIQLAMNEILLDEDSIATFNVGGVVTVTPPVAGPVTLTFDEDGAAQTTDLASAQTGGSPAVSFALTDPAQTSAAGTFSISGSTFTFTPTADAFTANPVLIEYTATNTAGSSTGTISVNVNSVNDPPVAGNDGPIQAITAQSLTILTSTLLANDTTGPANENETPVISLPSGTTAQGGTVTLSGDEITYTSAAGVTGADSFTYSLSDGTDSVTATVTLDVVTQVDAPVAANGTLMTGEDLVETLDLSPLLSGGAGTVSIVSEPSLLGDAEIINGTTLQFTPVADAFGPGNVVYQVTNMAGTSQATIGVTVTSDNDDPVAANDGPLAGTEDQVLMISVAQLLSNDTGGPANEDQTVTLDSVSSTSAQGGTVAVTGNMISYTPVADFNGMDSFTYTMSDRDGATDTATVSINVGDVVEAPIVAGTSGTIDQGDTFTIDLDTLNTGGDAAQYTVVNADGTTANIDANGVLSVTPAAAFIGTAMVEYQLQNAGGTSNGTLTLTVNEVTVNVQPVSPGDLNPADIIEDTASVTINLLDGVTDANPGDTLRAFNRVVTGDDSGVTLASDGTVVVDPTAYGFLVGAQVIDVTVTYQITDSVTAPINRTANLRIVGVNDAPVARPDTGTGFAGTSILVDVLTNDDAGDGEQQALTVTAATSDDGAVTINSDGTLTFLANTGFTGDATINYTVSDSQGGTASSTATVSVSSFNPSVISGAIFQDSLVDPLDRDSGYTGVAEGKPALASIPVRLTSAASENASNEAIDVVLLTNVDGIYRFVNVAPGTYQVSVELPEGIVNQSETTSTVTIGPTGGETVAGPTVSQLELAPSSLLAMADDYLASDYLRRSGANAAMSNNGQQGGSVAFNADGSQSIFIAGEGFDDALFVELALSNDQDSALLTVVDEDGDVMTAVLGADQFRVARDGSAARFFGGIEDFTFIPEDTSDVDAIREEYAGYRQAIDQILGQ